MTELARRVWRPCKRLLPPGSHVLVAMSGGPDSQALLDVLVELAERLELGSLAAVGVDHGLRPAAAAELDGAEALARSLAVPFHRVAVEVNTQGNLLAAARRARYRALRHLAHRLGAERIAVGHTATDQVETILWHLSRGAGLGGAAGIPIRRGPIVRPLLQVEREALQRHLQARGIRWADDPSNRDRRRARSRLRHEVLPILRQLNPQLEAAVTRFAALARRDGHWLGHEASQELQRRRRPQGALEVRDLLDAVPQAVASRVMRRWLAEHELPADWQTLRRLRRGIARAPTHVALAGTSLAIEQGWLWPPLSAMYDFALPVPGRVPLPGWRASLSTRVMPAGRLGAAPWPDVRRTVAFAADRLHLGLRVRPWQHGDRLQPFGLAGHIKVGDLFTNAKIPRSARAAWPVVVEDGGSDVLWVVGVRRGSVAPVTASSRAVIIDLEGALPWSAW